MEVLPSLASGTFCELVSMKVTYFWSELAAASCFVNLLNWNCFLVVKIKRTCHLDLPQTFVKDEIFQLKLWEKNYENNSRKNESKKRKREILFVMAWEIFDHCNETRLWRTKIYYSETQIEVHRHVRCVWVMRTNELDFLMTCCQ